MVAEYAMITVSTLLWIKKTTEYDFSQLNPHMIYHRYGYELGSEDAYDEYLMVT